MNWSARLFFFILAAYVVYIFAAGDGARWKQIFTQKATARTTPGAAPGASSAAGALAGGLAGAAAPGAPSSATLANAELLGKLAG